MGLPGDPSDVFEGSVRCGHVLPTFHSPRKYVCTLASFPGLGAHPRANRRQTGNRHPRSHPRSPHQGADFPGWRRILGFLLVSAVRALGGLPVGADCIYCSSPRRTAGRAGSSCGWGQREVFSVCPLPRLPGTRAAGRRPCVSQRGKPDAPIGQLQQRPGEEGPSSAAPWAQPQLHMTTAQDAHPHLHRLEHGGCPNTSPGSAGRLVGSLRLAAT